MTIFPKVFFWAAVKIIFKFSYLTSLKPISDEICSLLVHIFVEISKYIHKIKKICLILKKICVIENNSGLLARCSFFWASPEFSRHLVNLETELLESLKKLPVYVNLKAHPGFFNP